jgi:hypothetical protein
MNFKKVKMIDSDGNKKPYGDRTPTTGNIMKLFVLVIQLKMVHALLKIH